MNEFDKPTTKPINGEQAGINISTVQDQFIFKKRNEFSRREVGLNHPDISSYLKLADNGDIEIMASPGVGIVISAITRSISIFADTLKIYTTEDDGIRWNKYSFNYAGSNFTEPFLVPLRNFQKSPAYHSYETSINNINLLKNTRQEESVTIRSSIDYGAPSAVKEATLNKQKHIEDFLSEDEIKLLQEEAKITSDTKIQYMKKLMFQGYTFNQAKTKTNRDLD